MTSLKNPGSKPAPRLTIVLPLKGRHLFTLRFLWHANRARLPYRFLIADGQVHPALAEMLENAGAAFPNLDIQYIRYPDDRNFTCYYAKMADALSRVTTPYAMMADNDDFLAASGLERSIAFLDSHADFVCSSADVAGFSVYAGLNNENHGLHGRLNRLYSYYFNRSADIAAASAAERLRQGGLTLWLYYAVFRTEALATVWREVAELDFSDLLVYEAFHIMRALTQGKAHADAASIGYLRQYGTSLRTPFTKDWAHHLVRSRFTADVEAAIGRISSLAAMSDGSEPAPIAEDVRGIIESKTRSLLRASYGSMQGLKQSIRGRMPELALWLKNRPRFFIGREKTALLRQLKQSGASAETIARFRTELAGIEEAVAGNDFADYIRPWQPLLRPTEDLNSDRPLARQAAT